MVAKSRRRVHGRVSRHVEPVEVEEVEVEEAEELEDEEELEDDVEELEDDVEDDQEEEEEEVTPRKARRFQKPAPKVVTKPALKSKVAALPPVKAVAKGKEPVTDTDELVDEEIKPVGIKAAPVQVAESILVGLLESLEAGKAIVITKINEKKWQITSTEVLKSTGKLRGKEYWDKVRNPEYNAWRTAWKERSFEEKKAYAKKAGIKWTVHANARIEEMNLTQAVREAEGVSKYKPEYASRSARAALRG